MYGGRVKTSTSASRQASGRTLNDKLTQLIYDDPVQVFNPLVLGAALAIVLQLFLSRLGRRDPSKKHDALAHATGDPAKHEEPRRRRGGGKASKRRSSDRG